MPAGQERRRAGIHAGDEILEVPERPVLAALLDDLLRGLLADPVAGPRVRERFDFVLVDEFQDTNALQADIVSLLRPDSSGVTCVGDDAQAIYSFRAPVAGLAPAHWSWPT